MNLDALIVDKPLVQLLIPAVVVAVVFVVIFLVARRQSRPAPSIRTDDEAIRQTPEERPSNGNSLAMYSSSYETPLFLLLGPSNAGHSAILHELREALSRDRSGQRLSRSPNIADFDGGTVLAVEGDLFCPGTKSSGSTEAWQKFIDDLQDRRPERPVDGVVLTLPCANFLGAHALSTEESLQRATDMSKRLRLMRDRFGFCFPVYVVVTNCHHVPGFAAFAGNQLLSHEREIFGWSNPFTLDARFDPGWIGQAFAYVGRVLELQRMYFFARHDSLEADHDRRLRDELFLFPARFRELEAPVSSFLANLFRESGHRDALQFRGVYFTGQARAARENGARTHHSPNGHATGFVADLFDRKIFPERGLASPVDTTLAPRNREISLAKALCWITATVLLAGTSLAWRTLSTTANNALPHLACIDSDIRAAVSSSTPPKAEYAYDAIYAAQALSGRNFQSLFLPFSLVSGIDQRLEKTMPGVFDVLVYPGLNAELDRQTSDLLKGRPATEAPVNDKDASYALQVFVKRLVALENDIVRFNRLAPEPAGNGQDAVMLASNLAPAVFADVPRKPSVTMDHILARGTGARFAGAPWHYDGRCWTSRTVKRLEAMVTEVLRQRMNENQLLTSLNDIVDEINRLEQKELDTYQQLDALNKSLGQVQSQLGAPDLEWVAKNGQLPPDVTQALAPVFSRPQENVLLCGADQEPPSCPGLFQLQPFIANAAPQPCPGLLQLQAFIENAARAHFLDFRARLPFFKTDITGDLIAATDGKLQLSPGTVRLQTILASFLKLPFVPNEGTAQIQDLRTGQQLFWNSSKLQEALQDKAAYDKFFSDDLANTPDNLQDALEDVALDRLKASMVDAIASSQQFQALPPGDKSGESTIAEARTFAAAAQSLSQLLDEFSELNFDDDYQDLSRVSTDHALKLLARIDQAFDSRDFYWPADKNFSSWTLDTRPTAAGYGVDDMMPYLSLERQDLQPYAAAAKPLVTFLQQRNPRKQPALLAKWLGIVNDLQKYESAPASSSLGSLESYLAVEMDKTVPPDCQSAQAPAVPVYFAQTQRSLARALAARCRSLTHVSGSTQYSLLAQFFDMQLAGRFPFSGPPAEGALEADPKDVVELFRLLDAGGKALHESLQSGTSASNPPSPQLIFVNQLEALRPIFAPMLAEQPPQTPAWDFTPSFRVNRDAEKNGNQIIDWTLVAGGVSFRNTDQTKIGHWVYGQPVTLTLRWAKDSPNRPVAGAPANNYPETRTVVYEYRDRWALLHMLIENAAPLSDFNSSVDLDPQTLVFGIHQQIVPAPPAKGRPSSLPPGDPTTGSDVKVFVGIRLYAPGKTSRLILPAFPSQAPAP